MIAASNTYSLPARIWRTLTFADLLDAAGIGSILVSATDAAEWAALATAAGVHTPSPIEGITGTIKVYARGLQDWQPPAGGNSIG